MIQLPLDLRQDAVAAPFRPLAHNLWHGFRTFVGNKPLSRAGAYGIYCIPSGKWYIGITGRSIAKRLREHCYSGDCKKLLNAIGKHGVDSFIAVPLYYCIANETTDLPCIEQELINIYAAFGKTGYNVTLSAGIIGPFGPEHGALVSAGRKLHFANPANRLKHRERQKKSHARPEVRAKLSASLTEYFANPEARKKDGEAITKSHARPEVKANISNAQRTRFADPQARAVTSAATKDAMARPDVIAKVSKASSRNWQNPDYRAKQSKSRSSGQKSAWQNPEIRAQRTAAITASWQDPEVRVKRLAGMKAARGAAD